MIKYIGFFLAVAVAVDWFVSVGAMAHHFYKKSLRPGGGIFFLVYMFACAFAFLFAEVLIVVIDRFTDFASLI